MACLPVGYSLSVMVVCNAGTSSHLISLVPIKINQNLTYKTKVFASSKFYNVLLIHHLKISTYATKMLKMCLY